MAYIKLHLSQTAYLALATALCGGCTSISHEQIESSKILSIGNVHSTTHNKENPVSLITSSKTSGYLACFYQDQEKSSILLYPNQLSEDAYITENTIINLSEPMPFQLTKTLNGLEKVACFLTQENINQQLPNTLRHNDFSSYSISKIKAIFAEATKENYHYAEVIL